MESDYKERNEAFNDLADRFYDHFGLTLYIREEEADDDGTFAVYDSGEDRGVDSVGTVRANWLKRQAAKTGFEAVPNADNPNRPARFRFVSSTEAVVSQDESNEPKDSPPLQVDTPNPPDLSDQSEPE